MAEAITQNAQPAPELLRKVEERWLARAKEQGYGKPKSATYRRAEYEFFIGAMAAFEAQGFGIPPGWYFSILRGDNVANHT